MKTFKCPKCPCNKIECIQTDCIISTPVYVEDGEVVFQEEQINISDSHIDRFQCQNCGWTIPLKHTDEDELVKWLEKQP